MHKFIENIKKFESKPFIVSNFLNEDEIKLFKKLYDELPIEIDNKRQKIVKKNGQMILIKNYKKNMLRN